MRKSRCCILENGSSKSWSTAILQRLRYIVPFLIFQAILISILLEILFDRRQTILYYTANRVLENETEAPKQI